MSNVITIKTISNKPATERKIDLNNVPDAIKNEVIKAALLVNVAAGNCEILSEDLNGKAEHLLDELNKSIKALEQYSKETVLS